MTRIPVFARGCLSLAFVLSGCGPAVKPQAQSPKSESPAKVAGPVLKEAELSSITLTEQAARRLGIRVVPITRGRGQTTRRFTAEVVLPPGRSLTVTAPVAGTLKAGKAPLLPGTSVTRNEILFEITPLLPLPRDLRVTAQADVEQARTRVETAQLRQDRADRLLLADVGTVRAQEEARNELEIAKSALAAAQARLDQIMKAPLEGDVTIAVRAPRDGMIRQILADPGQVVSRGAALFEVADLRTLWLRVPIYAGEAITVKADRPVPVETLSGVPIGVAKPVTAPPTGDPLASTVDFYFEAPVSGHDWKPGERVGVELFLPARSERPSIPYSAVVYDIHGGSWVYEQAPNRRYVRHRVLIDHTAGGIAYLASGPRPGTPIVVEGAAELWGVEFGAGK